MEAFVLPLVLDVSQRRIAVVGRGHAAQQRYEFARDGGAGLISLYVLDQDGWACHAEAALYERLPVRADLQATSVVLIAGLPAEDTARIASLAREVGALVNAEDQLAYCDFHVPAVIRRGDLLFSVSTGGTAPGLSQRIKRHLQDRFGPVWSERVAVVAQARARWRAEGRTKNEIAQLTQDLIDGQGWLAEKVLA